MAYTRSHQLYYYKNKKKILERYREYMRKYHAEYYQKHKEEIRLKNAAYREKQRLAKESSSVTT